MNVILPINSTMIIRFISLFFRSRQIGHPRARRRRNFIKGQGNAPVIGLSPDCRLKVCFNRIPGGDEAGFQPALGFGHGSRGDAPVSYDSARWAAANSRFLAPSSIVAVAASALFLCGCNTKDNSEEVQQLQKQVAELETRLDIASSSAATDKTAVFAEKIEEINRRMGEFESSRGELKDSLLGEFRSQNEKLQRMFRGFNEMHEMIQTGQTWAAFGIGYQGHAVARTRHGSFLIEMEGQEPLDDGYRVTLRVGNPTGLHVHQFKMYGNFGSPPPDVSDAKDYATMIQAIDGWEASLKEFSASYVTSLAPNKWTRVGLVVPAERLVELQFIRFRMEIDHASLVESSMDQSYAQFGIDYKGATLLETKQGTFPMTVRGSKEFTGSWELDILIGNPLGMTITNSKLVGSFGPAPPQLLAGESHEAFSQRLVLWDQTLTPFEVEIEEPLQMDFWNPVKVKLRAASRADLAHIRARFEIMNVSLKNP